LGIDRVRPHLAPAAPAATAGAVAVRVNPLRTAAGSPAPSQAARADAMGKPAAPPNANDDVPPAPAVAVPRGRPAVDASIELAAEAARIEERFRRTAADLLPLARAEQRGAALRRFDRDVAALEAAVVRARAGKPRERAWHTLVAFLERAALGEPNSRVAVIP
jgi:hypothetical protein